jgi:hypothetical protein
MPLVVAAWSCAATTTPPAGRRGFAASAREIRVSRATPLAEAVRAARPGDVLVLEPGVHRGGIWIETSGAPGQPIVIRGPYEGHAIIEGGEETLDIGGGAHDLVIESLELRGSRDNVVHVQAGAHDITLRDLVAHDAGPDGDVFKINQAHDITIERVECYHPGPRPDRPGGNPAQECIDFVHVDHAVVRQSYLHDGGNMLLYAKGGSTRVLFEQNVIVGQGPEAIDPCVGLGAWSDDYVFEGRAYEAEDVLFRNNVVANCRAGGVGVYDAHRVWIVNNTLLDDGEDVVQFRAGNAPRAESRDVLVANNVIADRDGSMHRAWAVLSHGLEGADVRNNAYWNAGAPMGANDGELACGDGLCADPRLADESAPGEQGRAAWLARAEPCGESPVLDRGVRLDGIGAVHEDARGRPRPLGAGIDLGALEADPHDPRACRPPTTRTAPSARGGGPASKTAYVRPAIAVALAAGVVGAAALRTVTRGRGRRATGGR